MYIVGDAEQVQALFKPTPTVLTNMGLIFAMKNGLGTPDHVLPLYTADDSGPLLRPVPGSTVRPENRIRMLHMKAAHDHLAGSNGIKLGERYMALLVKNMSADPSIGPNWVEFPDLFLFVQNLVFPAGTETLFGSTMGALHPTLTEDFWAFSDAIPMLLKGLPRWLAPRSYKKRDKLLRMIKEWHSLIDQRIAASEPRTTEPDWEPDLGSRYIRERQKIFRSLDIMDADGRASEDLGLMFA